MTGPTFPWLSDDEVAELCKPLEQPAAQLRYLKRLGLHVERKPNGRPLLMRSELERVLGGGRLLPANGPQPTRRNTEPDRDALLAWAANRRRQSPKG